MASGLPPTLLSTLYPWTLGSSGHRSDPVTIICEGQPGLLANTIQAMQLPTHLENAGCSGRQSVSVGARTIPRQHYDFATPRVAASFARTHTRLFVLPRGTEPDGVLLAPVHRDHVRGGCILSDSGSFLPGGLVLEVAMTFMKPRDMVGDAFVAAGLRVDRLATGNRGSVRQCDGRRTASDGVILHVR